MLTTIIRHTGRLNARRTVLMMFSVFSGMLTFVGRRELFAAAVFALYVLCSIYRVTYFEPQDNRKTVQRPPQHTMINSATSAAVCRVCWRGFVCTQRLLHHLHVKRLVNISSRHSHSAPRLKPQTTVYCIIIIRRIIEID